MTFLRSKLGLLLGAPVILIGGLALAGVSSQMLAPSSNGTADPTAGDLTKLTPEETLARSKQMSAQSTVTENRISGLLKRAETKKDMVMINCVSDKLTQLRGYITVGNGAASAIETAISHGDDGTRAHNLDRQIIVYQKILVLGTEAEGCVGEDVSYVGVTRVDVDIDPNIPNDDPTIPHVPIPVDYRPPQGECPNA